MLSGCVRLGNTPDRSDGTTNRIPTTNDRRNNVMSTHTHSCGRNIANQR